MAHCSKQFVEFLPKPWRNLEFLDNQIISYWSDDYQSLLYFIEYLENNRNSTGWDRYFPSDPLNPPLNPSFSDTCYVDDHATLCYAAIDMLSEIDKEKYSTLINLIKKSKTKRGSYPFFSGYDWAGLPEPWRKPGIQDDLMVEYLEKEENLDDVRIFLDGLKIHLNGFSHSYYKSALLVGVISFMKGMCDEDFLSKVQRRCRSLVSGDDYNTIMIRQGCLNGRLAIRGWICGNDPTIQVEITNIKIKELLNSNQIEKVKEQYNILRSIAIPWRLKPDSWMEDHMSLEKRLKKDEDDKWKWNYYVIDFGEEISVKMIDDLHSLIERFDLTVGLSLVDKSKIKIGCGKSSLEKLVSLLKGCTFQSLS